MEKEYVLKNREEFFNQIIEKMKEQPNDLDIFLNQADLHCPPLDSEIYSNHEYGDLKIPVEVNFFEKNYKIYYTIWHVGHILKVGVVLPNIELQIAITDDTYKEVENIWGKDCKPTIEAAHQMFLLDWEFNEPNIFDSYLNQEKYILGMRHLNFRICRIIHDKLKKDALMQESNLISNYKQFN